MPINPYEITPPARLEDEILFIETAGEMPEVALADSLHHLGGGLSETDLNCLRAAAVRAYTAIIQRDLNVTNLGLPHFRGLGRAADNLARLGSFLGRLGWPPPQEAWKASKALFQDYLHAERASLADGRAYASASRSQVEAVARAIGLDLHAEQDLLVKLEQMPCPDFLGLKALMRLEAAMGIFKYRIEDGGMACLEVSDNRGKVLATAELGLLGADDREDPVCRERVELVWRLLDLPEC